MFESQQEGRSRDILQYTQVDFPFSPMALKTNEFGLNVPRVSSQKEICEQKEQPPEITLPGLCEQTKSCPNSTEPFETLIFTNPYSTEISFGPDTTGGEQRFSISSKDKAPLKQKNQTDRPLQFAQTEARAEKIRVADAVDQNKPDLLKEFLFKNLNYPEPRQTVMKLIAGFTHDLETTLNRTIKSGKLDSETITAYRELLNNPARMKEAARTMLMRQATAVIEREFKSGRLSESDAVKMKVAIDHGSLPRKAIEMLVADERSRREFGVVSRAIYTSILDTTQQDTSANVFAVLLGSKRLPRTTSIPYLNPIGDGLLGTVSMLGSQSYALAFGEQLEYVKRSNDQAPDEDQLRKIERLIETNKSLAVKKDSSLSRYQEILKERVANLNHRDLYQSLNTALKMRHEKAWQGGGLWTKAEDQSVLTAIVEGSLIRQVKAGKLSEADKESQLRDLKNKHVIRPGTAIELLGQEAKLNVEGIITDVIGGCFQNDINARIVKINERLKRENVDSKQVIEPLHIKTNCDDKPKSIDKISLCHQIELTEQMIRSSEKYRNPQLESLQTMLSAKASTLDPQAIFAKLLQYSLANVEDRFAKGQLPPATQKQLSELNQQSNKDSYNNRLRQLAGEDLKSYLRAKIDEMADRGNVSVQIADTLWNSVEQRQIPDQLTKHLINEERRENSFGMATKSAYATIINQLDREIPVNLDSLLRSGLTIPDGGPMKVPLSKTGRPNPEKLSEDLTEWLDKKRYRDVPIKILDIARDVLPTNTDLKKLFDAITWNEEARKILIDNRLDLMVKGLEKEVKTLGKEKEWARRPGENIDAWISKVGPMIDLTREVRATYQALKLAQKMAKTNSTDINKSALIAESEGGTFPGKISFNKEGYPTRFILNLPVNLDASRENDKLIENMKSWLRGNKESGLQAMKELAEAALDDSRILIVGDMPGEGKIRSGDETKDYNLSEHRVSVENVVVDGQKKIRIKSNIEYFHSRMYNVWNIGADSVGSRQCLTLSGDSEIRRTLKQSGIPDARANELIRTIKINDIKLSDQEANSRIARIIDTKYDARRLATIKLLEDNHVEKPEEIADKIYKNYRDYKPTDLVCIADGEKTVLVMAENVDTWQKSERRSQLVGDGISKVFDVAMVVIGFAELRAAGFGASQLAKFEASTLIKDETAIALRQSLATAIRTHRWHACKSLALGVSGPLVSNPEVISTDWGKRLHSLRDTAIMIDLLSPLGRGYWRLCRGPMKSTEALKAPATALSPEAIAANKKLAGIMTEMEKVVAPGYKPHPFKSTFLGGTRIAMHGAEVAMGIQLANEIFRKLADDHVQDPGLKKAPALHTRMQGGGGDAARFLATTADALTVGSKELKTKLLSGLQQPDKRVSHTQALLKDYYACSNQSQKVAIAIGLLMMSQKPDGSFIEPIGWHKTLNFRLEGDRYSRKLKQHEEYSKVFAGELLTEIDKFYAKGTPEQKMAVGDALVCLGKMNLPQYATMCKQLLTDEKAPKAVKISALIGLASCISIQNDKNAEATGDKLVKDWIANFRVTPSELEATIRQVAETSKDLDVHAMATGVYHALRHEDRTERQILLTKLSTEWQAIRLAEEVEQLKSKDKLRGSDKPEKEVAEKEKQLDKILWTLYLLNNPTSQVKVWTDLNKVAKENDSQAMRAAIFRCDLETLQDRLARLPVHSAERIELESQIKVTAKTIDQIENKLAALKHENRESLLSKEKRPSSLSNSLRDRLKLELNQKRPPSCTKEEWAARRLVTIDGINMLRGSRQDPDLVRALDKALLQLVSVENGPKAIAALDRLLKNEHLEKPLREALQRQLIIFLLYRKQTKDDGQRQVVDGQIDLLSRSKALIESGILENTRSRFPHFSKNEFVEHIVSLLAKNPDTVRGQIANVYAGKNPEVRLAAAEALGTLKDFFSTLPLDQKKAILKVLYETMKSVPSEVPVAEDSAKQSKRIDHATGIRQSTEPVGEPQPEVRRKAFESAKILSDSDSTLRREFIEKVRLYSGSERDFVLSKEYAAFLRNIPMSKRTEDERRVYDAQVDYWKRPRHGISNQSARQLLLNEFEYLDPDKFKRHYDAVLDKYRTTQFDFNIIGKGWRGRVGSDSREKVDEAKTALDHVVRQRQNQFNELVRLASQPGNDQHKACLIWLATCNYAPHTYPTQLDAAKEIARMVRQNLPDRTLFYDAILEAFSHDNNPEGNEVRLEFISMLSDLLTEGNGKCPQSSKEVFGRLASRALQLELDRPLSSKDKLQSVMDQETRLLKLLDLVDKSDYVLALPSLKALKERTTLDVSDTVKEACEAVTIRAKQLYLRLHDGLSLDSYGGAWHFDGHSLTIDYMKVRRLNRQNSAQEKQFEGSRSNFKQQQQRQYGYPGYAMDYGAARKEAHLQQTHYCKELIDQSAISQTRALERLHVRYSNLDPQVYGKKYKELFRKAYETKVTSSTTRSLLGKVGDGVSNRDANVAVRKLSRLRDSRQIQFGQLMENAARPGNDLDKACLVWLATSNLGPYSVPTQLDAARAVRNIAKANLPINEKALLLTGIVQAFKHDNLPCFHEVCMEFIGMLGEQLGDGGKPANSMSKQLVGMLAFRALQLEMERKHSELDTPDHLIQRETRLFGLVKLLDKCDYSPALLHLDSLRQRPYLWNVVPHVNNSIDLVNKAADELYSKLKQPDSAVPDQQKSWCDSLWQVVSARQRAGSQMAQPHEPRDRFDSIATKDVINHVCEKPIVTPDDPRIPLLETLLDDPDQGVALSAAWQLIRWADPAISNKETVAIMRTQPFFALALRRLDAIAGLKTAGARDANPFKLAITETLTDTASDARQLRALFKKWTWNYNAQPYFAGLTNTAVEIAAALKTSASLDTGAATGSAKSTKQNLKEWIRLGATKPERRLQIDDTLKQIASLRDEKLGAITFGLIRDLYSEKNPHMDKTRYFGITRTTLEWLDGSKTRITDGINSRRIEYPDGSWTEFLFDSENQVTSYKTSENNGVVKMVNRDFKPGAVTVFGDGPVSIRGVDGVCQIRLASGESAFYFESHTGSKSIPAGKGN